MSKKIELKLINEKGEIKTYIGGLAFFVEDGSEIKAVVKKMQECLNAKTFKRKFENDVEIGFDGDNVDQIKLFLTNNNIADLQSIVVNNQPVADVQEVKKELTALDKINKKISLHFMKEKRTCRTYIVGLKNFLNTDEIIVLSKKLQKILGTNSILNEEGDCGFNGDYTTDSSKKKIIKDFFLASASEKLTKDLFEF
jgi:hypothetical protein